MKRDDFSETTKLATFARQHGRCGECGKAFCEKEWREQEETWEFHHVLPRQVTAADEAARRQAKHLDNCVMLCHGCHQRAHANANYRNGPVAPALYFPFSHGGDERSHEVWAARMDGQSAEKFEQLRDRLRRSNYASAESNAPEQGLPNPARAQRGRR